MTGPASDDPFNLLNDIFGTSALRNTNPKKPEKGLPWAAKRIDGKLYLPIEQVVELLKQNDVLPAVRRGLERHINNEKKEK